MKSKFILITLLLCLMACPCNAQVLQGVIQCGGSGCITNTITIGAQPSPTTLTQSGSSGNAGTASDTASGTITPTSSNTSCFAIGGSGPSSWTTLPCTSGCPGTMPCTGYVDWNDNSTPSGYCTPSMVASNQITVNAAAGVTCAGSLELDYTGGGNYSYESVGVALAYGQLGFLFTASATDASKGLCGSSTLKLEDASLYETNGQTITFSIYAVSGTNLSGSALASSTYACASGACDINGVLSLSGSSLTPFSSCLKLTQGTTYAAVWSFSGSEYIQGVQTATSLTNGCYKWNSSGTSEACGAGSGYALGGGFSNCQ
jgi:hypothetical protein